MAFNPFSWFRDNQKGVMIGLIGLSMVVFIFQFGPGDAVSQWLRSEGRDSGEVVASLYGKKVRESEIGRTAGRRKLASDFLFGTVQKGQQAVAKELTERMQEEAKKGADRKESSTFAGVAGMLQEYQSNWRRFQTIAQLRGNSMAAAFLQQQQADLDKSLAETGDRLRQLERSAARPDLDESDRLVFRQVAALLGFQRFSLTPRSRAEFYFGGGTRTEDVLDFRLWQLQADRLGIKLTDADVMKEVVAEAAGDTVLDPSKSFADQERVRAYLLSLGRDRNNALTAADLADALREEFRVVMAQGALLGGEPGVRAYRSELTTSATPSLATPDEFLDFYRQQRTALRVRLYPISVESYLPRIKGEPADAELRARFDRGARVEATPDAREPGYKQPRRIKIEYVFASPDDAHYQKLARDQAGLLRKLSDPDGRLSSAVVGILTPGLARLPVAFDPLAKDFEAASSKDFPWSSDPNETSLAAKEEATRKVHDVSVINPASLASLFAGSFGGPTISGLVTTRSLWYFQEVRRSVPFNLELMLAQLDPRNPLKSATAALLPFDRDYLLSHPKAPVVLQGGTAEKPTFKEVPAASLPETTRRAMAFLAVPPATPRSMLEPQIVAARQKRLAEDALRANYRTIEKELHRLAKKPAEARAYIARAVQEYHLGIRSMPAVRSQQGILEALSDKKDRLNLEPLRAAFMSLVTGGAGAPAGNEKRFTEMFVNYLFQDKPARDGSPAEIGTYVVMPLESPGEKKQDYLFWRTEDHKAVERSFSQVRDEVVAAWRLDKARALARARAEELEAEVDKMKATPADAERFLKEQKLTSFELDNVAEVAPPAKEVHANPITEYRRYQVPADKSDLLPYPPADFVRQLMKLTRPGDATVVVDRPAKTFYVALLVERAEPSLADFKKVYGNSPGSDQMYVALQARRREEYRKSVMEQLRRDAGADLDKEGRFKLPESLRKGDAGQGEES